MDADGRFDVDCMKSRGSELQNLVYYASQGTCQCLDNLACPSQVPISLFEERVVGQVWIEYVPLAPYLRKARTFL